VPKATTGNAGVLNPVTYGGGKIFYVDPTNGIQGLIAAPVGLGTFKWSINTVLIANANDPEGAKNTAAIIASQSPVGDDDYAAQKCKDYHGGNKTDWYLPSKEQLTILCTKKVEIGFTPGELNSYFWSSTQVDAKNAWYILCSTGNWSSISNGSGNGKLDAHSVRAIRSF
jgi:hypothetical protein